MLDLLRLDLPSAHLVVSAFTADEVQLSDDARIVSLQPVDPTMMPEMIETHRRLASHDPKARFDEITRPESPRLRRLAQGIVDGDQAGRITYLVELAEDALFMAFVHTREYGVTIPVASCDELFLNARLREQPDHAREVLPAWRACQATPGPGMPFAKFCLAYESVPIMIGAVTEHQAEKHRQNPYPEITGANLAADESGELYRQLMTFMNATREAMFSEEDDEVGGRQTRPDLIEFRVLDQPLDVRVDFWMEPPPDQVDRERVFEGELRIEQARTEINLFDATFDAPIPPGNYSVAVSIVHRGAATDRTLTDRERFGRDDLERYEVEFRRRD